MEADPESRGRKLTLEEEVAKAKVDEHPEVRRAAQVVLDQFKALPGGQQHVQQAIGSYNAQADRGSTATVSVNQPRDSRDGETGH